MLETLFYDGIIALVVGLVPVWFVQSIRLQHEKKGSGPGPVGAVLALLWAVIVYGSFIEPKLLTVRTYDVRIGEGGRQVNVALFSDTHLGIYDHREWLARVVAAVNALHPDLVAVAGDITSNAAGIEELAPFKDLRSRFGTYAALGNWDYRAGAVDVRQRLGSYGVHVLVNRSMPVNVDGNEVRIIGLDDMVYGKPDLDAAMRDVPPGALKLLLVHEPDAAPQAEARGIDLVLAGHTHGGQVRLPLWGAVPRLPISIGQQFDKGLFYVGPTRLFITPGVGESGTRARLFDPPEVSFLRITY